ncbi:MAG: aconitate hydratase AcnA [Rhodobacteraceae bacterium]|nr:aconitate hydratase AcnA [Paracoccaceae bacterium]
MALPVGEHAQQFRKQLTGTSESRLGSFDYFSIALAEEAGLGNFSRLPASLAVVLENLLRFADGKTVAIADIEAVGKWCSQGGSNPVEISYRPARVLMQDFTGVPAVVDLAAMRDGIATIGGDPKRINPQIPVDLVIDHSVMIDEFGNPRAFQLNVDFEYIRNVERYKFLKWGQAAFDNFRVVPPGTGICHQVNLEYLGKVVCRDHDQHGNRILFPDTLVGTDSHTTMINGLGVLGWGVGGIEAEAAMLGQPISMLIPEVVGFKLHGRMTEGTTATDLVLKIVQMLREKGVVGKFVEFFGPGLDNLPLADRATIANMAPEYGATCGFFPIDDITVKYLKQTGRSGSLAELVEVYARANGLWRSADYHPIYSDTLELDISEIIPAISGPKRPQDHTPLDQSADSFRKLVANYRSGAAAETVNGGAGIAVEGTDYKLRDGSVVIASITSCTNTSNPYVMVAAGLVARNARRRGLTRKPWVKTSLAPGSKVVSDYLENAGLQEDLDAIGFNLVGYGCTTCIGNSGPLQPEVSRAIADGSLYTVSVLSGNRNFEGRISPDVRGNYLASPPLVVAFALAGNMDIDLTRESLGSDSAGEVFLKDIWPEFSEVDELVRSHVTNEAFLRKYSDVFSGDEKWRSLEAPPSLTYDWPAGSTYVQRPPYFEDLSPDPGELTDIEGAKCLALLGDMVTTDHISPAGSFAPTSSAGKYLMAHQVPPREFNSYGSRRGNHEVMMRGTFANIRLRNEMLNDVEGGYTIGADGNETSIYDAAMSYLAEGVPLVVIAGQQYGAGSSRDWAAKGTSLLGVKAVIAESYERIHRSNLVGMGVIPFEFLSGVTRRSLELDGTETVSISGIAEGLEPLMHVSCTISHARKEAREINLLCRVDTEIEIEYLRHGGVLHFVLRKLAVSN